ncbi:hypothetical protein [Pseudanabaena minima]
MNTKGYLAIAIDDDKRRSLFVLVGTGSNADYSWRSPYVGCHLST